jgi:hypothetical protein
MGGEIGISQAKPGVSVITAEGGQATECFVRESPPLTLIDCTRQGVGYRVKVRRNVEAKEFFIIPGIDDDTQASGINDAGETTEKTCRPYASGKGGDLQSAWG